MRTRAGCIGSAECGVHFDVRTWNLLQEATVSFNVKFEGGDDPAYAAFDFVKGGALRLPLSPCTSTFELIYKPFDGDELHVVCVPSAVHTPLPRKVPWH